MQENINNDVKALVPTQLAKPEQDADGYFSEDIDTDLKDLDLNFLEEDINDLEK